MHRLLMLLLLSLAAYGRTPEIYAGIGDPVYAAVEPVRTLSTQKAFRDDKPLFTSFVQEAAAAKKEGFWLDGNRRHAETKQRAEVYLRTLRALSRMNADISNRVKKHLLDAINGRRVNTYYAIKKSAHPVFKSDGELHRAMVRFERKLARERGQHKQVKAGKDAAYLRSYDNLRGTWKGSNGTGSRVTYRFSDKKRLTIVERNAEQIQTFKGNWKIASDVLQVSLSEITNQKGDGVPHTRSADIRLSYKILKIDSKKIELFDQRRQTEVRLAR